MLLRVYFFAFVVLPAQSAIVDGVAVVVGNHPIKTSELERDLRITAFLNGGKLDLSGPAKKACAARLIDQLLIRNEMAKMHFAAAAPSEVEAVLTKVKKVRFATADQFEQAFHTYGINAEELKSHLLWQLSVLRFVSQRFGDKPASKPATAQEIAGREEKANERFFAWLAQARQGLRVSYHEEAFT